MPTVQLFFFTLMAGGFPEPTQEIWASDGTAAGTVLVKGGFSLLGGAGSVTGFTTANNFVYFAGTDTTNGVELWKTNGTDTVLVKNLMPGFTHSYPHGFAAYNNVLYFTATPMP